MVNKAGFCFFIQDGKTCCLYYGFLQICKADNENLNRKQVITWWYINMGKYLIVKLIWFEFWEGISEL